MAKETKRGSSGGTARKEKLSPERRSEIAKEAAKRRWSKKDVPADKEAKSAFTPVIAVVESKDAVQESENDLRHCPACMNGQSLEAGEGTHVLLTIEHPIDPFRTNHQVSPVIQPPKATAKRKKPMVKEFGKAHSYAEKRLAEALKERAEAMGKVAMLNAEIPSLVQIIKALGMTPNLGNFQDFTAPMPNMTPYPAPGYQQPYAPQTEPAPPNNIDPALFQANSGPLPGLVPAASRIPLAPKTSAGGAMDLDYVPVVEDEGAPGLPKMGNDWV